MNEIEASSHSIQNEHTHNICSTFSNCSMHKRRILHFRLTRLSKHASLFSMLPVFLVVCVAVASISSIGLGAFESAFSFNESSITLYTHPFDGYTLFAPMPSNITYLIDNSGEVVHTWNSDYKPSLSVYLLENGSLLRTASIESNPNFTSAGGVQQVDWNGSIVWEFVYTSGQHALHHDIEVLPSGNVLMIAWECKTDEEAIAAGRDPSLLRYGKLWPDHIIEVEPTGVTGGSIVWEWHVWDHLIQDYDSTKENYGVVASHPELVDINFAGGRVNPDLTHINSIDYNEEFDQILLSVNTYSEIWVIDHSTTTEEAAGHTGGNSGKGGDILYRWGNPQAYRGGDADDRKFFKQHDAQWIELGLPGSGNILVFNNGRNRPDGSYSSVDEIVPPVDENGNYSLTLGSAYGPEEPIWTYKAENPTDFYSSGISGAQRLPNGNTLICNGQSGIFFEVTSEKEIVWEYLNCFPEEGAHVFKIRRYGRDFPGLLDLIRPHDVAIVSVTLDKTTVIQGEEVTTDAIAENQGSYTENFNVTAYVNTTQIGKETVSNLGQGANQVLSFTWDSASFAPGNYTVKVVADVMVNETDTLDNTFKVNVRLLYHDVAVVDIISLKTVVGQGYSLCVNVTVRNRGDYTEVFNLTLHATTTIIDTLTNMTLMSGNSTTISFIWNTTTVAYDNYTISCNIPPVQDEIYTVNNILVDGWVSVTIPGDVDGDYDVDIYDIVKMCAAYGCKIGDLGYDANCDVDVDGDIDIYDIVIACSHYGETYS
jgi:hypothetical protein